VCALALSGCSPRRSATVVQPSVTTESVGIQSLSKSPPIQSLPLTRVKGPGKVAKGWTVQWLPYPLGMDDLHEGADTAIGWTSSDEGEEDSETASVLYMSPGSEVLKVLAVDSYPGTCHSDLAVEHDRVCWGSENIERHTLFTWRPGMAAPRALYSNTNPHDIGDISVSGDLVLVATLQPDDYDSLSPVDGGPTWDPHEWRLVSLQTPGVAKRLPTSPTGARAVLGDGFVTWTEPEHDKLLRYVLIDTAGNIGPVRLARVSWLRPAPVESPQLRTIDSAAVAYYLSRALTALRRRHPDRTGHRAAAGRHPSRSASCVLAVGRARPRRAAPSPVSRQEL